MGLFRSLKQFAAATGKDKNPAVLGIDVGTHSIKVVELEETKEGTVLNTYGEYFFPEQKKTGVVGAKPLTFDEITTGLKEVMLMSGVGTMNVGIGIPFASSLATVIPVPPLDDEKLQGLIQLEARKYIPVPVADVYLDWQRINLTIPEGQERKEDKVLLFAIHKQAVALYQQIIDKLNLDSTIYEMELFSSARSSVGEHDQSVILADIGASYTRLCAVKQGQILSTRKINKGGDHLTLELSKTFNIDFSDAEGLKKTRDISQTTQSVFDNIVQDFYRTIAQEIRDMIRQFEGEWKESPIGIMFVGGAVNIAGCEQFMSKELSKDCSIVKPLASVAVRPGAEQAINLAGPEFAVAAGIALRKIALKVE